MPTVVYHTSKGDTKYYVTYSTSGTKTTIADTAVLDVSIYKRWLMFGDSEKPDSVSLMLFGRSKVLAEASPTAIPYLPVTDALYGDVLDAAGIADLVGSMQTTSARLTWSTRG